MKGILDIGKKLFSRKQGKKMILLYHHIGHNDIDPWEMAVTPENFESHLEVLKKQFRVLPLSSLPKQKDDEESSIYLSFDDAYLDNYLHAFPMLKQFDLPATFFVATQILENKPTFWWDVLEELFLGQYNLPSELRLKFPEQEYCRKVHPPAPSKGWSAWTSNASHPRQKLYLELASILKTQPPPIQHETTSELLSWSNISFEHVNYTKKMNAGQIKEVFQSRLIEIGAHSVHHPALGHLVEKEQKKEINESKETLESLLDANIDAFAYPHGHLSTSTSSIVREAGFKIGCTTEENIIRPQDDLLTLPRIWVKNWNKDAFAYQVNKWFYNR